MDWDKGAGFLDQAFISQDLDEKNEGNLVFMSEFELKKIPNKNPDQMDFKCFIQFWARLD